ncbi:MAG: hypothetical protein EZS28_009616 [Streblomastix strix]|uniref:Uncharacterized protein n=1 Tax=Streblomastix strix TaxID=222440 RepID=A0A5J4WKN4_9EUKA|nr:MAG: hypothetical protein EZS28_009616 [Streblomastix strix]
MKLMLTGLMIAVECGAPKNEHAAELRIIAAEQEQNELQHWKTKIQQLQAQEKQLLTQISGRVGGVVRTIKQSEASYTNRSKSSIQNQKHDTGDQESLNGTSNRTKRSNFSIKDQNERGQGTLNRTKSSTTKRSTSSKQSESRGGPIRNQRIDLLNKQQSEIQQKIGSIRLYLQQLYDKEPLSHTKIIIDQMSQFIYGTDIIGQQSIKDNSGEMESFDQIAPLTNVDLISAFSFLDILPLTKIIRCGASLERALAKSQYQQQRAARQELRKSFKRGDCGLTLKEQKQKQKKSKKKKDLENNNEAQNTEGENQNVEQVSKVQNQNSSGAKKIKKDKRKEKVPKLKKIEESQSKGSQGNSPKVVTKNKKKVKKQNQQENQNVSSIAAFIEPLPIHPKAPKV